VLHKRIEMYHEAWYELLDTDPRGLVWLLFGECLIVSIGIFVVFPTYLRANAWIRWNVKLLLCLTKCFTMKTYWGSGGIAPHILNLGTRWGCLVSYTPWPFYFYKILVLENPQTLWKFHPLTYKPSIRKPTVHRNKLGLSFYPCRFIVNNNPMEYC